MSERIRNLPVWCVLLLLVSPSVQLATPAAAQSSGQKQTDRLIKRAESAIAAINSARQQVQTTLAAYNAFFTEESTNLRSAYKSLVKAIERSEKQAEQVRQRVDAMQVEAEKLFAEWTGSLSGITNEDLRSRSETRLEDTRQRYNEILEAGRRAREEFDPFVANLHDQVNYLGHDLNPDAIASLEEDATALNDQATKVFEKIDAALEVANEYVDSLRP